jgi:hypothetical protein
VGGKKRDARLHTIRGRRVRKVVSREKEREKGRRGEGAKKEELRVMRSLQQSLKEFHK